MDGIPSTSGTLLKDMITKNYQELCNAIDCSDSFLTLLYTNDIITQGLMSEVKSLHDNTTKAAKILDFLKDCRTDADVPKVVDILKTSGYSRAVDLFTEPMTLPTSTTSYGYQGVVAGYIERQELQQKVLEHLTTKPNKDTRITFPVVVLHGFGGNGKSQMARRLVQILTKEINDSGNNTKCSSMWINAVSEASVIEGFRNFANVAKEENASGFYKELKDKNLLLVFDDGDDFEMLKKFLPLDDTETNIRVIITAHSEWACGNPNVKNIPVANFTVTEFRHFIAEAISCAISEKDAKQLEGHTGRIPAILSLVCKGFSQRLKRDSSYTIEKHFAKYGDEIFTFGEDGKLVPGLKESDYKKSAKAVVKQQLECMDNCKSDGPELIDLAKFILNCISYCDPNEISEEEFFTKHPRILRKANEDYGEIRQAIGVLKEFGWIELIGFTNYGKKLEIYRTHACYQIGLKSQFSEEMAEITLSGMIDYIQFENFSFLFNEKFKHQQHFWPHICSHSNCRSLLNYATKTSHCLIGLAKKGLLDECKFLANAYQDQGQLVHILLQDEGLSPSSPMLHLFRNAVSLELVKYFILEIKAYYDHLEDPEKKAWIRHQLLFATIGVMHSKESYETFVVTFDTFDLNINECLGEGFDNLLHYAVCENKLKFVQLLIEKGANVNEKNVHGETPLHRAWDVEVVRVLLCNGANIHEKNDMGETALHKALWNLEVLKLLIETGANINEKDFGGKTPLHMAVQKNVLVWEKEDDNLETVKCLVEKGANIYEINGEGITPIQLAFKLKKQYIVDYFISINQSLHQG